jgi:hypothetical protein
MTARSQAPDVQVCGPAVIVQGQAVPDLIYVLNLIIRARREPPGRHQRLERLRADLLRAYEFEPQPSALRHCDVAVRRARAGSNMQPGEVTVADAERLTGLSRRQIQRLARDGLGRRIGVAWAVDRAGLLAHVATQRDRRQETKSDDAA